MTAYPSTSSDPFPTSYPTPGHSESRSVYPRCFSPPYLHRDARRVTRRAPVELTYGEPFRVEVNDANTARSAVLIRNGSCTHSANSDQRFVELEIVDRDIDSGGAYPEFSPPD